MQGSTALAARRRKRGYPRTQPHRLIYLCASWNMMRGQIVVVQAAELMQARKIIPDLATWVQCFSIYAATLSPKHPARMPELMAYQTIVAKASQRYRWPSLVVYDQNFRQAAGNPHQSWIQVFMCSALPGRQSVLKIGAQDVSALITLQPAAHTAQERSNGTAQGEATIPPPKAGKSCIKYNKFKGDCKFGKECRYLHVCSACKEPHPISRCNAGRENTGSLHDWRTC